MGSGTLDAGDLLDPDAAMEYLTAWKEQAEQDAAGAQTMSARLQEVRLTASDGNGLVEVTVDASGVLVDLVLGHRIQRVAPEVVARTILDTIRSARGQLVERSREIIEETMGSGPAARSLAQRVEQRLRIAEDDGDIPGRYPDRAGR